MMKLYCAELAGPGVTELERTLTGRNGFVGVFGADGCLECPEDCGLDGGTGVQVVSGSPTPPEEIEAASREEDGPLIEWFAPAEMIGERIVGPKGHQLAFEAFGGQARGFAPSTCGLDDPDLKGYYRPGAPANAAPPTPKAVPGADERVAALEAEVASLRAQLAARDGEKAPEAPRPAAPKTPDPPKADPKRAAQEARLKAQAAAKAAAGG